MTVYHSLGYYIRESRRWELGTMECHRLGYHNSVCHTKELDMMACHKWGFHMLEKDMSIQFQVSDRYKHLPEMDKYMLLSPVCNKYPPG